MLRNGFVSNSSSTSFCIVGVRVKPQDVEADGTYALFESTDWDNSVDGISVTEENVDAIRRIHPKAGPTFMKIYDSDLDGGWLQGIEIEGKFDVYYGPSLNYSKPWTAEEIEERYEGRMI